MSIIHIDLREVEGDDVTLRYFKDEPSKYSSRAFPSQEIRKWHEIVERGYYVDKPDAIDYSKIGQDLYNWLDGSDRILKNLLPPLHWGEVTVLAIATAENLAHLPWELLHNGEKFLVQNRIVPVRWVSSKGAKKLTIQHPKKERALQVLFMASSPIKVEPVLDYEAEEGGILKATEKGQRQRCLELVVEESGSLEGLSDLLSYRDYDYFDVLHLMGHTTVKNKERCFIAENITGEADYVTAQNIVNKIGKISQPQLIFLSACNTAKATQLEPESVPSMSEMLIKSGARAVLGWGKSVLDTNAILAAEALYDELSLGREVANAVSNIYQKLIDHKARDWHLLRLYTADTLPGNLVTSLDDPKREPAPPPSVATKFLDREGKVKVPTRENFVGRRRQLQNCLRVFNDSNDKVGVLIHGMGGLGKSSLAARLCDRYLQRERVVWVGSVYQEYLAKELADKLGDEEQRNQLQNSGEELKYRLKRVFDRWSGRKSFLLVLDDFEHNLEPRNDEYVLKPEAANVLNAIVWAIKESYSFHRIIITCRYDFDFTDSQYFYKQPLDALRGADLQKKWKRLTASDNIDETLRSQVEKLADGNHRFLEKLYDELNKSSEFKKLKELNKSKENSKKLKELQLLIYNYLKAEREELLREVLEDKLSKQIKEDSLMSQMLQRGLVFELPVPREAVEAICKTIPNWDDDYINKAIALGLLEVSHDQSLRVPRYLVLEKLDEISLNKIAAKKLYQLWYEEPGNPEKVPEERLLEIHRLAQLVNEIEIEAEITEKLATRWNFRKSQCQKLIKLCTSLLERLERSNLLEYNYVSKIQNVLGSSYLFQGRYRESEYLKNKVLENISDKDPLILAEILDDLGYISTYLKDYETAKSRLDEAFKIRQEEHQLDHIDLVKSRSNLAYWHREKGKWNEAEDCYKKALEMCERIQENEEEEEGIFLAEIYHDLGAVYYEQALDIKTAHDNDNKESSIKTTEDKVQEQELYKKAEKHYSQALNQSRTLINKSLSVATFLSSLAKVLCCQKKDEEAQEQFKKALDIRKGLLGMHLEIVADLKNLGFINSRLGNYKEAEIYFIEALKLMKNLIESKDNSVFGNQERAFKHVEEIVNALKLEPTCSIFIIIAIRPTITCRICMLITVNYESV